MKERNSSSQKYSGKSLDLAGDLKEEKKNKIKMPKGEGRCGDSETAKEEKTVFKTITPCPIAPIPDKESLPISLVGPIQSSVLEACSVFSFAEKDLAAVEDESNKSQQGALVEKEVHHILGCINKTMGEENGNDTIKSSVCIQVYDIVCHCLGVIVMIFKGSTRNSFDSAAALVR
ncbi:hypothetical protein llap_1477 [Limosa lapponica baueri]|uniref:Uncharacterized protein n=1 Tax=Limosa lapponica baueri TaxID=1758121 RepID=A0A2I0UQ82_LIMLA|nr:hypothetical protein llap_1477 [Limosa lapponica baueri]